MVVYKRKAPVYTLSKAVNFAQSANKTNFESSNNKQRQKEKTEHKRKW